MTKRTSQQMRQDRDAIVAELARNRGSWVRVPKSARPTDVAALVAEGRIERQVRREFDKQPGNSWLFGGAGVVQRHRAYVRVPAINAES